MNTRTRFKLLVYIFLLICATFAYAWWFNFNRAKERDYERIGDLRVLQSELLMYYSRFNTFKIPDCADGSAINACPGKDDRKIFVQGLVDPLNAGVYRYVVERLADDDFRISFVIEAGIPGLPTGKYVLTKSAIGR